MKEEPTNPLKYALKNCSQCVCVLSNLPKKKWVETCRSKAMTSFLEKVSFLSAEVGQGINPQR